MSNAPVVADTSVLINLAGIGLLNLLLHLYGAIWIPKAVLHEYNDGAAANDPDLEALPWLTIIDLEAIDPSLPSDLGPGEAAAITLALACNARFVLLDDKRARRVAIAQDLGVTGTLAVLLRAKRVGLITAVGPHIESMRAQGRRFGTALVTRILSDAGE